MIELTIIRRMFKAPRVIVLVATIGIGQLAIAVTRSFPAYKTGELQTAYPGFHRGGFLGLCDQIRNQHSFTSLWNTGSQANVNERSSAKILHTSETSIENGTR